MQQTSLIAYYEFNDQIKNNTYKAILSILENYPNGLTDRELSSIMGYSDPNKVRPRRNELVRLQKIKENGKRVCNVSGKVSIVWNIDIVHTNPPLFPMKNNNKNIYNIIYNK